ncbi:MAG: glutamine--fructose-6-phosphate transaminase (isomerizing) [Planctomycetota bacterium]
MCGIIGCVGLATAAPEVLAGLRALEYRGYDSAGLAALDDGQLRIVRVRGRVAGLDERLRENPVGGSVAIGHTRWATHGVPNEINAHPHRDCTERLAIVHNGIIENHAALRKTLEAEGHAFRSGTDSEVLAHLLERGIAGGMDLTAALRRAMTEIEGTAAVAAISADFPDRIVAARRGSPLVVGLDDNVQWIASDALPIAPHTRRVVYLEDGETVVLRPGGVEIFDRDGHPVRREPTIIAGNPAAIRKDHWAHFMLKEIHEQPRAVEDTLRGRIRPDGIVDFGEETTTASFARMKRMVIVGMGTSWHAGLIGRNLIERFARIPVQVDYAADFRYRDPVMDKDTLVLALSQSGETADTLEAVRLAAAAGVPTAAIANVMGSSLSRETGIILYTRAGPEIGVASTKTFIAQIAVLALLAIRLGRDRGTLSPGEAARHLDTLRGVPAGLRDVLRTAADTEAVARVYADARDFLFLGRGMGYPLALEGALKLKEIAYIHAEGYHAAEMKHGPIALIDENMPVLFIAGKDRHYGKTAGNIQEVRARGGRVIAVAGRDDGEIAQNADHVLRVPDGDELANVFLTAVPLQLLAYYAAVARGCDVDKPRNLAKSVTVE